MFSQAHMIESAASAAATMETAGWSFMVRAAVAIDKADKVKTIKAELFSAIVAKGLSEGTATNYVSKASAVAKFLKDCSLPPVADETEPFDEYCERIIPTVRAFWSSGIRDIKSGGPNATPRPSRQGTAQATAHNEPAPPDNPDSGVPMPGERFFAAAALFLPICDDADLSRVEAMIREERERRAAAATEPLPKAA